MFRLLSTTEHGKEILSECKAFVTEHLEKIHNCYNTIDGSFSKEEVGRIVLVDVCFLLEFFRRLVNSTEDCPKNDNMIFWSMRRDAALVENQLPLFAIKGLLDVTSQAQAQAQAQDDNSNMKNMCVNMMRLVRLTPDPPSQIPEDILTTDNCPHLLDLVRCCHLRIGTSNDDDVDVTEEDRFSLLDSSPRSIQLRSATQLSAAGVSFRKAEGVNLLALDFSDGVFRIPALVLHDSTETLMINLLAYGHLACNVTPDEADFFSSYVMVMMHLVQTRKDLALLERKGIIVNEMSSRADGPTIFRNVNKEVFLSVFKFKNLCDQIDAFANFSLRRYKMSFITSYLKSPWTVISLIAAGFLLCLTIIQTFYSIYSWHKKKT
ncbi:putative UPF0481 protein At3g02645 [Silene latifolia]|uniref:putative UPF0481 protein At3g02645 n=1 Tax=Silene latifolia TaxID=37657 RepID=UPI003D76C7E7